jgi:purine-binding chemotaxis protein CheW
MTQARELNLIAFRVGGETFLVDIMTVRQIIVYSGSTPVPAAPSFVEGIIVLRDEVVPIIDVRERLGTADERPAKTFVLIIDTKAGAIGLRVDEVRRMIRISSDDLMEPPDVIRNIRRDFLIAVVKQDAEVYLLMDVQSILTADEQSQLQSVELSSVDAAGTSVR